MSALPLVLVANARLPAERAQSLQVVQMAAAFARGGAATTLLHARRRDTLALAPGQDVWGWAGCAPGPRPRLVAAPCVDWIDRVPRAWQYLPGRLQELSFARAAVREVRVRHGGARVLSREVEVARALVRAGRPSVFLELHRVPGSRVRRRWVREACARCVGVVAISEGVREDLVALGVPAARIVVEHDGFEPARFGAVGSPPSREERRAAREALGLAAEGTWVAYTGGLLEWKGVDLLVDAARRLPALRFVIAGGMPADVSRLRARAAGLENVRIEGFVAPERVGLYLRAADLGVVPNRSKPAISARHTSPLKVFEAMAAGLPLVASDLPSLRELLEPERDALLVPPDDAGALAAGIARLAADEALRERLARRLAERAHEHSWDARARRLLAWMEAMEPPGR